MEKIKRALDWFVPLLNSRQIPFHVTGGLAAYLYGARRPVNDIDVDMPASHINSLITVVPEYVESTPARCRDATWDLYVATINFEGQLIDLAADEAAFIHNKSTGTWDPLAINLRDVVWIDAFGHRLPVQNPRDLVSYKEKIAYDESKHLYDIEAVLRYLSPEEVKPAAS
jgi:hypothetical protein